MKQRTPRPRFAICINDGGYVDDLKARTLYRVLPDESAAKSNYLRIVDETGEDYLYPAAYFVFTEIPQKARTAFRAARTPDESKLPSRRGSKRPTSERKFFL